MTGAPRGSARITRWTVRSRIVEGEEEEDYEEEGHRVLRQGFNSRGSSSSSSRVDRTVGYTRRGNVTSVTRHGAAAPFRLWRRERRRDERNIGILRSPHSPHSRASPMPIDFSDAASLRKCAAEIARDNAPEDGRGNRMCFIYLLERRNVK